MLQIINKGIITNIEMSDIVRAAMERPFPFNEPPLLRILRMLMTEQIIAGIPVKKVSERLKIPRTKETIASLLTLGFIEAVCPMANPQFLQIKDVPSFSALHFGQYIENLRNFSIKHIRKPNLHNFRRNTRIILS